jgi:hypothetical protein
LKKFFASEMPMFYAGSQRGSARKHTHSGGFSAQNTTPCAVAAVLLRSMGMRPAYKMHKAPYTTGSVQRSTKHYM